MPCRASPPLRGGECQRTPARTFTQIVITANASNPGPTLRSRAGEPGHKPRIQVRAGGVFGARGTKAESHTGPHRRARASRAPTALPGISPISFVAGGECQRVPLAVSPGS